MNTKQLKTIADVTALLTYLKDTFKHAKQSRIFIVELDYGKRLDTTYLAHNKEWYGLTSMEEIRGTKQPHLFFEKGKDGSDNKYISVEKYLEDEAHFNQINKIVCSVTGERSFPLLLTGDYMLYGNAVILGYREMHVLPIERTHAPGLDVSALKIIDITEGLDKGRISSYDITTEEERLAKLLEPNDRHIIVFEKCIAALRSDKMIDHMSTIMIFNYAIQDIRSSNQKTQVWLVSEFCKTYVDFYRLGIHTKADAKENCLNTSYALIVIKDTMNLIAFPDRFTEFGSALIMLERTAMKWRNCYKETVANEETKAKGYIEDLITGSIGLIEERKKQGKEISVRDALIATTVTTGIKIHTIDLLMQDRISAGAIINMIEERMGK